MYSNEQTEFVGSKSGASGEGGNGSGLVTQTTMVAPYHGEELSLQELFSAFSHKLKEVSVDPNEYVAQGACRWTPCSQIAGIQN